MTKLNKKKYLNKVVYIITDYLNKGEKFKVKVNKVADFGIDGYYKFWSATDKQWSNDMGIGRFVGITSIRLSKSTKL